MLSLAACHGEVRHRCTIPAIVAVHCVVAPAHGSHSGSMFPANLARPRLQTPHKLQSTGMRAVAPIGESMDIHMLNIVHLSQAQQGFQVRLMGMNASIAEQAADVELRMIFLDVFNGLEKGGILVKAAVLNGLAD